jgi:TolB-like protein/DNA-binding winged helix-turn-helix (wHTH) protein/tetratricopeptide (TPR) repeat protein
MLESSENPRLARFGLYEVDLRTGELRKQGLKIRLQEKPFQILSILLERRGDVVTRKELRERLWPEDTFVDFDNSLNTAMSKLREALGESAGSPRYVETLTRRGYRFIAPVELLEPEAEVSKPTLSALPGPTAPAAIENLDSVPPTYLLESPVPAAAGPAIEHWRRSWITVATIGVGILLAYFFYVAWVRWKAGPPSTSGRIRLAVLPFKNMSGDPEQEYLSEGLTEEMIAQLGRLHPRLAVIARTSAMQYAGTNKSINQIGNELDLDYIVEGSVRRAEDRVRITAKLIQVSDETQLWVEHYERGAADVLALQSEVARRIAGSLAVELLPARRGPPGLSATTTPAAYEAYLKGRFFWNKRREEPLRKSIEYFQQAIQHDPRYAPAYSGLADAYIVLETYSALSAKQTLPLARAAATKALELDDSLAETRTTLAAIRQLEWDWTGAEAEFRRALELNPNYATARQWYSEYLTMVGRIDEAVAEAKLAQELDPLSIIINYVLGYNLYVARRYDEAIVQYCKALEIDPTFYAARFAVANTYEQKAMYAEALAEWQGIMIDGGRKEEAEELGRVFARSGYASVLKQRHLQLIERSKKEYVESLLIARLCLKVGRRDEAFEWLEQAYQERRQRLGYLKVDPVYDSIRSDPRYLDLLRRIGLPQ